MNTSKELNYRLYIQREENFVRQDVRKEFSSYDWIRYGEVEKIKSSIPGRKKNFYEGKGILSSNPLRNITYHFVISVSMIARVCMDAGMSHDEAYTLSDLYIRKVDLMTDPNKVLDLLYDMQIDFAERMQKVIKYEKNYSIYTRHAIDYIYDHLHEQVTMSELAEREGLNKSYFSKLFSNEVGIPVKQFILKAKLNTAKNMLENPEYSISDIAFSLGFSSQSAFTAAFKNQMDMTPKKYRDQFNYTHM